MTRGKLSSIALGIACAPAICCWFIFAKCCCPHRLRPYRDSEDKQHFERRQALAPRPLAVRPPERALTIPVPAMAEPGRVLPTERRGMTLDQSASRLMRLPLELREMIYRHVVGDTTLHIILKKHKLGHLRCKASSDTECPLSYNGRTLSRESCWGTVDSANMWSPMSGEDEPTDGDILPLLQSCRQIYSEATPFLYSTNCFSFSDLDALRYFSSTILPQRWSLVENLELQWGISWPIYDAFAQAILTANPALFPPNDEATWEGTWHIIASMKKLKSITVNLLFFDGFRDRISEDRLLAPLRQVTLPKKFEVHLNWTGPQIRDAPFKLFRPTRHDDRDDI